MTAKFVINEYTLPHICVHLAVEVESVLGLGIYLMWDGRLEPSFLSGSLREPRPDCRDV